MSTFIDTFSSLLGDAVDLLYFMRCRGHSSRQGGCRTLRATNPHALPGERSTLAGIGLLATCERLPHQADHEFSIGLTGRSRASREPGLRADLGIRIHLEDVRLALGRHAKI